MKILKSFIDINKFSRPARKIAELKGIVIHWTGNVGASAMQNRNYFDSLKKQNGKNEIYASAHYIIDVTGEIVQALPEDEIAYHCGTQKIDPVSKKVYTDNARKLFGKYASDSNLSPNLCTIGIELCPINANGDFSKETLDACIELCADILSRYSLPVDNITTHFDVVGWKDCPRLWVQKRELYFEFLSDVENYICNKKLERLDNAQKQAEK